MIPNKNSDHVVNKYSFFYKIPLYLALKDKGHKEQNFNSLCIQTGRWATWTSETHSQKACSYSEYSRMQDYKRNS